MKKAISELKNATSVKRLTSNHNKVYKVTTPNNVYIIKEMSEDTITPENIDNKIEQLRVSEELNKNGIKCITPLKNIDNYFYYENNKYYLIFPYCENNDNELITIEHIKQLAIIQSKIHKLNILSNLDCAYKIIEIDIDKIINDFMENKAIYNLLSNNKNDLKELKRNLCISHNDYKMKNVLWKNLEATLIDFDAVALVNPTAALCESAFTFATLGIDINYDYYKAYLKAYLENYGSLKEDFKSALYVSQNGKLRWLQYLFNMKKDKEIIPIVEDLILFNNNIEKFNNIYENIKKENSVI